MEAFAIEHSDQEREALGVAKATEKYLSRRPTRRMAPFAYDWVLRVHREMFSECGWPGAGKISKDRPDFGIPRHLVPPALHNLCLDSHVWGGEPVADSAEFHLRLVRIHPFWDGNGRWARLLGNIWLRQKADQIVDWPLDVRTHKSHVREEYLDSLEAALSGDLTSFASLHRRFLLIY